jgi:hypothetical protein
MNTLESSFEKHKKLMLEKLGVKEIAMNNGEYERDIENAAKQIISYATEFSEYPDINPYVKDISSKYKRNDDDVYMDIARIASKIKK